MILRMITMTAICVAGLSGCSTYSYRQEIDNFSTGIKSTVASYKAGSRSVAALVMKDQQEDYVAAKTRLTLDKECFASDEPTSPPPKCTVVPADGTPSPFSDRTQEELAAQAQVTKASQTFDSLNMYAAALKAVINAKDDSSLSKATQSLGTAVGTFSTSVSKVVPEVGILNTVFSSATSLINLGITTYSEEMRYTALQETVPTMDKLVTAAGEVMKNALLSIRTVELNHLKDEIQNDIRPLESIQSVEMETTEYRTRLAALMAKVEEYNKLRASNPSVTVSAMISAHNKLAAALLNRSGRDQDLANATLDFATAAGQLSASAETGLSGI